MFSTNGTVPDIVCYVCIYTWPVNGGPSQMHHFFNALVTVMQLIEDPGMQFWGNANSITFEQDTIFYCQLISGTPKNDMLSVEHF